MPFCPMCGNEIKAGELFCSGCGNRLSGTKDVPTYQALQTPDPSASQTEDYSAMSKEESIKLTEQLGTKYHSLEKMQKEIKELTDSLNHSANYQTKRYSAFRFFWPYLVYAAVACTIFYYATGLTRSLFFAPLILIVPVILIIVGAVRSRKMREECNYDAANYAVTRAQKMEEERKRLYELTAREARLRSQMDKYNGIVPVQMRNKSKMLYAKKMLETDKAGNFAEAMAMLDQKIKG